MKGFITKIISILVIAMMFINSSLLTIISVAIDEVEKIIDESKIDANYELNIRKYVNYEVGEERGLMVQTYLKDGIEYQEGQEQVPIKATNVVINAPKVNGEYPQKVEVIVDSTKLTNGDDNGKDVNYSYNNENGELTIITENKADEKGNVYSEYSTEDKNEYKLNFYYSSNCYDAESVKRTLEFTGKVQFKLSKDEGIVVNKDISQSFEVSENISGLISTEVTTSDIYNGYIESNKDNDTKYRTEYTEKVGIDIDYKDIFDEISISENDKFVKNDKEIETEDIVYKGIKINKNDVLSKLGEDGTLKITNENGEILAEINKDTEAKEDGTVEVTYQNEAKNIKIDISKPVSLGRIEIENTKEIKETMKDIDVTNIKTESNISCINNVTETTKAVDEETKEEKDVETVKKVNVYLYNSEYVSEIKKATTKVEVSVDNNEWTNDTQNDVTFVTTLLTNNEKYNLYKNPVIDIKLPEEVEKVVLGDLSLLYDEELKINSTEIIEQGNYKIIRIKIDGAQTAYSQNDLVKGANIVVPTKIILKKDINNADAKIECNVNNHYDNTSDTVNIPVNIKTQENIQTQEIIENSLIEVETTNTEVADLDKISVEYSAQVGDKNLNNGDIVHENEYIKYVAKIKNNSDKNASNLNIVATVPDGTIFVKVENKEITDEDILYQRYDECRLTEDESIKEFSETIFLNAGEEQELYFYVRVNNIEDSMTSREIKSNIKISNGEEEKAYSEINNIVKMADITTKVSAWETTRDYNVWLYEIRVTNNTDKELKNVKVNLDTNGKFILSNTTEGENEGVTANGNVFSYVIDSIPAKNNNNTEKSEEVIIPNNVYIVDIFVKAITTQDNSNTVDAKVNVEYNNDIYYTNPNIQNIKMPTFTIIQTSDKEGEKIKYGEEVEYVFTIKNESKIPRNINIDFNDYLDKNMKTISVKYENYIIDTDSESAKANKKEFEQTLGYTDNSWDSNVSCNLKLFIPNGEEITVKIKATPNMLFEETEVENYATLKYEYNGKFVKISNSIKNTILAYGKEDEDNPDNPNNPDNPSNPDNPNNPDNPSNPDNPNNPDQPSDSKYMISGIVWNDKNKNGLRETNEETLSGITVKLFDIETNSIVVVNNDKQIKLTDNNGKYEFAGISKGKYIVLFEYDTNLYKLTSYKISGGSEELNSDVINKTVNIDGVEKLVAVTDNINVEKSNIENINMGLIENGMLDLKLNKSITNVKVQYNDDTQEYNYNDVKLAKVEIPAKKINGTTVTIKYKIEITNEGTAEARVNSIIDYKPEGLDFDAKLNPEWSIDGNNNIKYYALAGQKIKSGESASVDLYLTKTISKDSMGIFTNGAEIFDISNDQNLKDIDSTEENKNKDEDDYSEAQVVISVKTGAVLYGSMVTIVLAILVLMIILFKKKQIKLKNIKKISLIFMLMFLAITVTFENTTMALGCWHSTVQNQFGNEAFTSFKIEGKDPTYYTHNYRTHGSSIVIGHLYCTDGLDMAFINSGAENANGAWDYNSTGYTDPIFYTESGNTSNSTGTAEIGEAITENKGSYYYVGDSDYIIGPYKANFNGSVSSLSFEGIINGGIANIDNVKICDVNGNEGSISSDSEFYIKVPANSGFTYINKMTIINKSTQTTVESFNVYDEVIWSTGAIEGKTPQILHLPRSYPSSRTTYAETTSRLDIYIGKPLTGSLTIEKRDTDTGASLSGAVFNVTGPNSYNQNVAVNGSYTITNLPLGEYTVTEIGTPNSYNLNLQDNITQKVTISPGQTSTASYTNKQYGNLKISKQDLNTGSNNLDGIKLKDIQFKIYIIENGQKKYLSNVFPTKYSYSDFNVWENNKGNAKTFTTDANAEFVVYNLPVYNGGNKITYYIEEYALPDSLQPYYEVKATADAINLSNGETPTLTVKNQQLYIDISGYVWEDRVNSSKVNKRDNLYVQPEPLISGITVRLKNKNNGSVIATQTTNSKGAYKFSKVKISELKNYTIEFEYNGLKYESVTANLNQANGSKAVEKTTDRTNFNNSFASITGGNAKGNSTTGYSKNQKGTVTNRLTYKNGTYSSILVQNTKYTTGSANGIVTAQNGSTDVRIYADTNTAGMALIWSAGVKEISNINLGIAERAQADLSIATDLSTIDMAFNGYSHTYNYDRRIKASGIDIFSELQKWNKTDAQKNNESSNYPRSYTRSVYKNYVYASGVDGEGSLSEQNKLQINLTYKIQIKNESSLYMSANEIANYFDNTLDYVSSYYIDSKGNKVNVAWTSKSDKNGYKQLRTTGVKDLKIQPGSSVTIYVTMKKNTIPQWKNKNSLKESTYNVTEITSYSSYTKNGNNYSYYAAIDKDSAPDNINVGTLNTYEDDTDMAPVVEFTFDEPRTISGYVFEDSTSNNLKTNAERKGDGKYNASNDGYVENVKVELITKSDNQVAYIYPKAVTTANFNADKAVYTTTKDGKGYYEFVGIIPGEYYIKFTYGDGTVVYKKSGESVNVTTQDYKSTIITSEQMKNAYGGTEFNVSKNPRWYQDNNIKGYSTAVDDYATRKNINKALSTITYGISAGYDKKNSDTANLQTMTARTPDMNIAIENVDKETTNLDENRTRLYDNIDFGIVERPRQSLNVTKEINYIKLTLATGSVLLEGNPQTDSLPYVTYPQRGILKIEADSEITQGATLEVGYIINVKNNSELDYDSEVYYKYGTKSSNDKAVNLTINSLVDYMDDELKTTYTADGNESGVWKLRTSTDIKNLIADNVYSTVKNKRNILVNNWSVTLKPTENKNVTATASKILSAEDEMAFANYVEILSYSNSVGRFYGEEKDGKWAHMTPGNYVYGAVASVHEGDDNAYDNANRAKISIVPSTGDNNIIYYVVGISSLVVVAGGVILIRKFVL